MINFMNLMSSEYDELYGYVSQDPEDREKLEPKAEYNPENPMRCECGAWKIGNTGRGKGHSTWCWLWSDQ